MFTFTENSSSNSTEFFFCLLKLLTTLNPIQSTLTIKILFISFSGASSGIGAATAVEFAKHRVKVAINGRNAENLQKTAKKCYEAGLKEGEVTNCTKVHYESNF